MQCTANLRNNGEIDHIKLNWSKDNLLTRWSELTGVDPPSFSSRKCYIYTCIHSPSNMRRAAASHLWGPRPRRCRPGRHCRWSSAPGTGCSRPASPCTEEDNIIINFPNEERRLASHNAAHSVEIANFYWGIDGKENYCVVRLRPL